MRTLRVRGDYGDIFIFLLYITTTQTHCMKLFTIMQLKNLQNNFVL